MTTATNAFAELVPSGYLVNMACTDRLRHDPQNDEDVWRAYDTLVALKATPRTSREQLVLAERACGVNLNPDGVLADLDLRTCFRPSSYVRNPMHTLLAGGVVNVEVFASLRALSGCVPGFSYATMRAFLEAGWQHPRSRTRPNLPAAFSAVREDASKKDKIFKAGASETLALYPVLRYFLEVAVPADCIRAERASFT